MILNPLAMFGLVKMLPLQPLQQHHQHQPHMSKPLIQKSPGPTMLHLSQFLLQSPQRMQSKRIYEHIPTLSIKWTGIAVEVSVLLNYWVFWIVLGIKQTSKKLNQCFKSSILITTEQFNSMNFLIWCEKSIHHNKGAIISKSSKFMITTTIISLLLTRSWE